MLIRTVTLLVALGAALPVLAQAPPGGPVKLESTADKASYGIGLSMGKNFKKQKVPINTELLIRGLRDALADAKPALTDEQIQKALVDFEQEVATQQATLNKQEGEAFLAANKKKPGVKTTKTGLQYQVLKEGTGPTPKATDVVSTHYRGTLLDGTEFDSSYARKEPTTFPLNEVIAGWTEALQLMKVGSKYKLFIPAELAYKAEGRAPVIAPNSVLVFELELLGIQKPESLPARPRAN